jgi:hypothetical protein
VAQHDWVGDDRGLRPMQMMAEQVMPILARAGLGVGAA